MGRPGRRYYGRPKTGWTRAIPGGKRRGVFWQAVVSDERGIPRACPHRHRKKKDARDCLDADLAKM